MILVGAMIFVFGACCAEDSGWQERLSQVEGVTRVDAIPLDPTAQFFEEKYLVIFEQPLDWNDPDAGSFPQRVEIGLRKDAPFAVMETGGYTLSDKFPGAAESLARLGRTTRRRWASSSAPTTSMWSIASSAIPDRRT